MLKLNIFCLFLISATFVARADTETLQWYVDGNLYTTTQCESGGDVTLPPTPTKTGYTFDGWMDYVPIEYLRSTGTQYIDTGIKVNSDYSVEAKGIFICGTVAFGQQGYSWGGPFVLAIACSSGDSSWGNNKANSTSSVLGINNLDVFTLKIDKNGIYTDGIKKVSFSPPGTISYAGSNLLLFATKASSEGWSSDTFFYIKIWKDNNVLVRDFIPVLDADGVACMYDKVTQQFFYNQGTGNFIAGPQI